MTSNQDIDAVLSSIVDAIAQDDHAKLTTYGRLAPVYDYLFGGSYDYDLQCQYVLDNAPEPSFGLLEVGCGTGRLLEQLADAAPEADLHGVDHSEAMVRIARDRLEASSATVTLGDATEMSGRYDVVAAFNVLPHFDETSLAAFFEHAASIVTDGGYLLFDYKDPRNNPNGLYDVWEAETSEFRITARFLTVYDGSQPYYAVAYEFVRTETGERYSTGELMEIQFHRPSTLVSMLREAGFETVTVDRDVGDQSGVFVASL